MEAISNNVNKLAVSISQIASETKLLREDFGAVVCRIQNLESMPKKRYDTIVSAIITSNSRWRCWIFFKCTFEVIKME